MFTFKVTLYFFNFFLILEPLASGMRKECEYSYYTTSTICCNVYYCVVYNSFRVPSETNGG